MTVSLYTTGLVPESKSKMEEKRTLWSDPASQEPLCCHLWYICSSKDWQLPSGMVKTKQYSGSTFGSCINNSGFVYFANMTYKLYHLWTASFWYVKHAPLLYVPQKPQYSHAKSEFNVYHWGTKRQRDRTALSDSCSWFNLHFFPVSVPC